MGNFWALSSKFPVFRDGDRDRDFNCLGDSLGTGKTLGDFFEGKSPEKVKKQGGGGGKNIGDFAHLTVKVPFLSATLLLDSSSKHCDCIIRNRIYHRQ